MMLLYLIDSSNEKITCQTISQKLVKELQRYLKSLLMTIWARISTMAILMVNQQKLNRLMINLTIKNNRH